MSRYMKLLRHYGPQGWWPTPYYRPGVYSRRFSERERFEICVGAILTQNTAWKNVEKAIKCLKAAKLLNARAIAVSPLAKLQSCIRSSGYYKQKAKKLKIFSKWLIEKYGGNFARFCRRSTLVCRQKLLSLWGIGPETADSMLLFAGHKPIFVIDAYTRRFLAEYGVRLGTYDEYQKYFMDKLPKSVSMYKEYHALIVAWGKDHKTRDVSEEASHKGTHGLVRAK